jgi:hypothetical protein
VLKGGKVAVIYDNDEAGWQHGDAVVRSVSRHADIVKAIVFPWGDVAGDELVSHRVGEGLAQHRVGPAR